MSTSSENPTQPLRGDLRRSSYGDFVSSMSVRLRFGFDLADWGDFLPILIIKSSSTLLRLKAGAASSGLLAERGDCYKRSHRAGRSLLAEAERAGQQIPPFVVG